MSSDETHQEHECTCLAFFRSEDALIAHLEEHRFNERYHSIEAEKCRTHARASDLDDQDNHGELHSEGHQPVSRNVRPVRKSRFCPDPSCYGQKAYGSRQNLRRHYLEHTAINEVCVGCNATFTLASQFIRHIEEHNDRQHTNLCRRKATYIITTCQEVRDLADHKLEACEREIRDRANDEMKACENEDKELHDPWKTGKKRLSANSGTRPARCAKFQHNNVTVADDFPSQHVNDVPYHSQSTSSLVETSYSSTHSSIPHAAYATQMDETIFEGVEMAPILKTLSFPPWNLGDLDLETVTYPEP